MDLFNNPINRQHLREKSSFFLRQSKKNHCIRSTHEEDSEQPINNKQANLLMRHKHKRKKYTDAHLNMQAILSLANRRIEHGGFPRYQPIHMNKFRRNAQLA